MRDGMRTHNNNKNNTYIIPNVYTKPLYSIYI